MLGTRLGLIPAMLVAAPLFVQSAGAQEDPDAADPGNTLVPLPVVFYQPETGVGFGVVARYYARLSEAPPDQPDVYVPPSMFQLLGVYTVENQIITQLSGELFLGGNRYRSNAELGYVRFPTKFWGIGNDTPDEAEEDYTPERINVLTVDAQRELSRGWYAGLTARAVYRELTSVTSGGLIDSGEVPGSEDGWSTGLGALATRDTRSSTTYPTTGSFHQIRATFHGDVVGDFNYGSYQLDLRRYLPLGGRKVVALQALGHAGDCRRRAWAGRRTAGCRSWRSCGPRPACSADGRSRRGG